MLCLPRYFDEDGQCAIVISDNIKPSSLNNLCHGYKHTDNSIYLEVMYGYQCGYCEGTVQPRSVKQQMFKHRDGFVILEDVTIGVCDNCRNRYYSADILHAVHAVATGKSSPERTEKTHLKSA